MKRNVPTISSTSTKKSKKNEGSTVEPGKNVEPCWICGCHVAIPCTRCQISSSKVECPAGPCHGCGRNYHLHCYKKMIRLKRMNSRFNTGICTVCKLVFG